MLKDGIHEYPFHWRLLLPWYWPVWLGVGLMSLLWLLPGRWLNRLAEGLTPWAIRWMRRPVFYARTNLRLCYPEWSEARREALLRQYIFQKVRVMMDMPLCWWGDRNALQRAVHYVGKAQVDALVAEDKPVIFLVCHTLSLEHAARAMAYRFAMMGYVKEFKNPAVDWLVNHSRLKGGGVLHQRGLPLRSLVKGVRSGQALYYFSDEDLGRAHSVFAPFLGHREKATLVTLPKLARLAQATVVPVYSWFDAEQLRYQVHFLPAFETQGDASEEVFAERLNQQLGEMIALAPEAYLWKLRLFKTTPEGAPSVYE